MIDARVDIKELDYIKFFVAQVAREAEETAQRELVNYASVLASDARQDPYPPELPNQRYIRTGAMQAGYDYERSGDNLVLFVNDVPDRRYVIDEEWQAEIHQGRHKTMQERVRETFPLFAEELEQRILGNVNEL